MSSDRHFAWQQSPGPNVRFGSKADIARCQADVRFTPKSGHWFRMLGCSLSAKSGHSALAVKNVVIRSPRRRGREAWTELNCKAQSLRGREVEHQFKLGRPLHRQVGRLLALKDAVDIASGLPNRLVGIRTVSHQAPVYGVIAIRVNRRQFIASDKADYEFAMNRRTACCYDHAAVAGTRERRHVSLYFIGVAHVRRRKLDTKVLRYGPDSRELSDAWRS